MNEKLTQAIEAILQRGAPTYEANDTERCWYCHMVYGSGHKDYCDWSQLADAYYKDTIL